MTDLKQVKVDNWGIYFLQRLKHFFNRTDYCDLTLQFQDNAQLKVHRLVLNACTEYFELLERTCEMYEDCLIMPDDLQADVVVPIINFMYTGQLEFKMELLDKLLQTSQIMNMPVLSKLLHAQRSQPKCKSFRQAPSSNYQSKQSYGRPVKRSHSKAFEPIIPVEKKVSVVQKKTTNYDQTHSRPEHVKFIEKPTSTPVNYDNPNIIIQQRKPPPKPAVVDPRPTRYEVPEELDPENIYDDSFHNISYESKPLQVHPETSKHYRSEFGIFSEASSSRKFMADNSSNDMVECRRITSSDNLFEDSITDGSNVYETTTIIQPTQKRDFNELFGKTFETSGPKVTIEAKDPKQAANFDHAKIISEVLKKYPHLVNSNKNIKLKILDTSAKPEQKFTAKRRNELKNSYREVIVKKEPGEEGNTYKEVLDSKEAARLIALGAENINGPWICLICGTPGKALHFPQYYKFRRHLVEVHKEKPLPNVCEYCGLKSGKRNYMLHHLYTKHDVLPPPNYHFPKCNQCNYIALTESFLIKHKATHQENLEFRCNVCFTAFHASNLLLQHIQSTGHKYTADRKPNLQCIYCLRLFLRENNLYAHLKSNHKVEAKRDGIVDDSDDEQRKVIPILKSLPIKYEPISTTNYDSDDTTEVQYQIRPDGNIHIDNRTPVKQTILNAGIDSPNQPPKRVRTLNRRESNETLDNAMIIPDNIIQEEIMSNVQDFVHDNEQNTEEYYLPNVAEEMQEENSSGLQENIVQNIVQHTRKGNITQPIEFVMSNEEQMVAHGQPVIFDEEGNPTKTLAVLTTLDSAHPNSIMINPEEYSLNVSHGVDIKNSNIVVVYSHSIDGEKPAYIVNSQYSQPQMLTTQDIGAQFVPSTAVITPTFEAAPSISEQVSVQQTIVESFERQQEGIVVNTTETNELAETSVSPHLQSDITISDSVHQHNVVELSSIQVATEQEQNLQIVTETSPQTFETHSRQSSSNDQNSELVLNEDNVVMTVSPNKETPMDIDNSINDNITNLGEANEIQSTEANCGTNNYSGNESTLEEEPDVELPHVNIGNKDNEMTSEVESEVCLDENKTVSTELVATTVCEDVLNQEVEEPESPTFTQNDPEILETANNVETVTNNVVVPVINKEPIQSLASEWSEDEDDIPASSQEETVLSEQINDNTAGMAEVEESIENIQQEMDKEIDTIPDQNIQDHNEVDISLNALVEDDSLIKNGTPAPTQEKISSLLNDWNDNDSQEDKNDEPLEGVESIEETTQAEDVIDDQANATETDQNNGSRDTEVVEFAQSAEPEPKEVANIKSLVSDWDEEDEEEK